MYHEDIIYKLQELISDWKDEKEELSDMCERWEHYDDPGSDPGLQYEQEMKVEKAWEKIVEFSKEHLK